MNTKMVLGVFKSINNADTAVSRLKDEGYDNNTISIITLEDIRKGDVQINDSLSNDVTGGAKTGGVIGAILGFLTGAGAITIPGLGALLIAGPIAAALGLTGVLATTVTGALTGALAGGLLGALKELGVDEPTAKYMEDTVKNGGVLLGVDVADGDAEARVNDILEASGVDKTSTLDLDSD